MAKIRVKNLKQLESAVKGLIHDNMYFNSNLQDKASEFMHEQIIENIYDAYSPKSYKRRGNNDGFADMDNIEVTSIENRPDGLGFIIENTTETTFGNSDKTLTEIFEDGDKSAWDYPNATDSQGRVASEERPFIDDTVKAMNANKGELYDALRKDLKNLGLKTR